MNLDAIGVGSAQLDRRVGYSRRSAYQFVDTGSGEG